MRRRIFLFLALLVCGVSLPSLSGLLIPPFSIVPASFTVMYAIVLSSIFLLISIFLRSRKSTHWQIFFAFFIAAIAILFDLLVNLPANTMTGFVFDMFASTSIIAGTIIALTVISGNSLGSIFLKKGNIRLGLVFGLVGFFFFAFTAVPAAQYLFQGQNLSLNKFLSWIPWILPLVLLNGVREELLYRGLFLKKFGSKLGSKTSNFLQAIIFSLSHSVAGVGVNAYTSYVWALLIFTFSLGLVWGYIMQRTDSILGSVLFHAGSDLPVFLGIFSNMF
jgi:membrane protease YdiL (CAAX protease family)